MKTGAELQEMVGVGQRGDGFDVVVAGEGRPVRL